MGVDWADGKHGVCAQEANCDRRESAVIPHKVELINGWAQSLAQRFGPPIAVAVGLSKGPIVYAPQKFDCFVVYPTNPPTLAKYRETYTPSGAEDDPTDAEFAVDLLSRRPDRFKPLQPQSIGVRTLASLVEQRRGLVNDKNRITNRLRPALKRYCPQALGWFDHIDTPLSCGSIGHWPTLTPAKRARKNTLTTFFHGHDMRFPQLLEERLTAIKAATPLTMDEAVTIPYRLQAQVLIEPLRVTLQGIKQFDGEIGDVAGKHADYALSSALPGAGLSLAPRLLVAFGEQRTRYRNAAGLQKHPGVAPVAERSGKKHWVHWRWQCPTFLRQTFAEWAAQTTDKSSWAGQYCRQRRAQGCTYQAAARALAFKWVRTLCRCWLAGKPYNEPTYPKALGRRGPPLPKQASETSRKNWTGQLRA